MSWQASPVNGEADQLSMSLCTVLEECALLVEASRRDGVLLMVDDWSTFFKAMESAAGSHCLVCHDEYRCAETFLSK